MGCINPLFSARKIKNCESAAIVADSIMLIMFIPVTAAPPKALKKVIALVMVASMRALPQSNFRSILFFSFAQQTINPLTVRVRILR